jgi:polysaccharide biosynthesis protein PslG
MRCYSWLLTCAVTASSFAAEIPEPVIPAGVGVNIHFVTGHQQDLDLIAAAGFKFIRMDFVWSSIERKKGEYDWAGYDELLRNLDQRGIRAMFIFDYSNGLYEQDNASPQHPESVAAFAAWAGAAAKRYRGRRVLWEIWNEPNISFWKPKPDVEQYLALASATCKAVREADPKATIVAPATSEFPWEFLEAIFKAGLLEHLDAVSVHPYRGPKREPETAAADYQRLRQLIDRYAPEAKKGKMPILSGEWGYSTFNKGVALETQAAFAARQQLSNLLSGVPLSIWYDWKNDGTDPNENEHNFGTVLPDLRPKPSYLAIKLLTEQLSGYAIARRLALDNAKDYVLVCTNSVGSQKLAAWTTGDPHGVQVPMRKQLDKKLRLIEGTGPGFPKRINDDQLELELGAAPQYVNLSGSKVRD